VHASLIAKGGASSICCDTLNANPVGRTKRVQNLEKHGMDVADLDLEFLLGGVVVSAKAGRFKVSGRWGLTAITVVFKPTGREAISIISMRPASRSERKQL
jgi:uncharacterized DUF497 family protein